jgi:hypothetical protein
MRELLVAALLIGLFPPSAQAGCPASPNRMLGAVVGPYYPFPGRLQNIADIESRVGHLPVIRRYYDVGETFPTPEDHAIRDRCHVMTFSLSAGAYTWKRIADGEADAYLRALGDRLVSFSSPVYLDFEHEFTRFANVGHMSYEGTPADYRAASQRVHDILTGRGVNLVMLWVPMASNWTPGNPWYGRMGEFWGSWNDWVAPDGYDWNGNTSFRSIFQSVHEYAVSKGRGFAVMETGTVNESGVTYKVNWYAGMADAMIDWNMPMVSYFHNGPQSGFKETWWIDGNPAIPVPELAAAFTEAKARVSS